MLFGLELAGPYMFLLVAGVGAVVAWGLAAFGQPGVERVIDLLNRELLQIMRQAGTPTLSSITPGHVIASTWR